MEARPRLELHTLIYRTTKTVNTVSSTGHILGSTVPKAGQIWSLNGELYIFCHVGCGMGFFNLTTGIGWTKLVRKPEDAFGDLCPDAFHLIGTVQIKTDFKEKI